MKVYLIHHSHTDLGYTEIPTKTLEAQLAYIDFLVDHFLANENSSFKWNCETLYIVEQWLKINSEERIEQFFRFVKEGKLCISANYLNMSDFCDDEIYDAKVSRAIDMVKEYVEVKSYMQADVNGLPIHFAKTLVKNGIENVYACVHTHHGMFPAFKKHSFFEWEIDGKVLNVFSSEHYMFGNGFGFSPTAITQHGFGDEDVYDDYRLGRKPLVELSKYRLDVYTNKLKENGYKDDFISVGIHGKFTDNAMPNPMIAEQVAKFNEVYGDVYQVEMVTLDEFFEKTKDVEKPRYTGDWPDWWTDGIASAPREVKMYKNVTNKYKQLKLMDDNVISEELANQIEENLIIYGEHTYGSWDSIGNPYGKFASDQWALKQHVLFDTLKLVTNAETKILEELGNAESSFNLITTFKAYNPYDFKIIRHLKLPLSSSDWIALGGKYRIYDDLGHEYIYNTKQGKTQEVWDVFPEIIIELEPKQEKIIKLEQVDTIIKDPTRMVNQMQLGGTDNVDDLDVESNLDYFISANYYRNKFLEMSWDKYGINEIINRETGENLLNGLGHIFRPICEVSPTTPRHLMGRNRKGIEVERSYGEVTHVDFITQNDLYAKFNVTYKVNGMGTYIIEVIVSNYAPKIDFNIKIGKDTTYLPENVYFELPIADGKRDVVFSKGTMDVKPRENQLPGTLIDYYSVYEGIKIRGDVNFSLATLDTQLIHVGDLEYRRRKLFETPEKASEIYIWAMNNIWETNFVANLGGFYEFRYVLDFSNDNDPKYNQAECVLIPINV